MKFESKYNIGQKVCWIYQLGYEWKASKFVVISRVCFSNYVSKGMKATYDLSVGASNVKERNIYLKEKNAEKECMKRNIIRELKK